MEILLSGRPLDVLLTDYAMPGMSGLDLVRDALRNRPKLSAIIVTGFDEFPGLRGEFSGVTLLRKPFEVAQLVEAIQAAVSTHRLHTGEH
jgi:YesN/AraC family two-component response regulator